MDNSNKQDIQIVVSVKQVEDVLNRTVRAGLDKLFQGPERYGQPAGAGYAVIEDRVVEWARNADLDAYIEKEAVKAVETVLPIAVEKVIRNRAGKVLSELVRSGALDDRIASVIEAGMTKG